MKPSRLAQCYQQNPHIYPCLSFLFQDYFHANISLRELQKAKFFCCCFSLSISSPEWLSDPFENSTDNDSVNSFRCLDDFAIVDYEMFEGRRGSDQSADTVPDGYTRMQETNREFVNMNNAVDTNESPATQNDSNQFGENEEPVAESGDQSMEVLEEWFNPTGKDAQPTQSSDRIDPVYSEVGTQISTAEPINTKVESHSIYSVVGSKISSWLGWNNFD